MVSGKANGRAQRVNGMRNLASPRVTKEILARFDFRPRKSLGQHFLVDGNVLERIIDVSGISDEDVILEVGPGIGTLTVALARGAREVVAIERDRRLEPVLAETLAGLHNVRLLWGDALSADLEVVPHAPNKLVSNLPYQVATPLIAEYLEHFPGIGLYVVMVQREVALRMLARPGGKDYGVFTVKLNYFCDVAKVLDVSRRVFLPQPEVGSAVVKIRRLEKPKIGVQDAVWLFELVRAAFGYRRKTIKRALAGVLGRSPAEIEAGLRAALIEPERRGETLSLAEFARLSEALARDPSRERERRPDNEGSHTGS